VVFLHRRSGGRKLLLLEKRTENRGFELGESTTNGLQSNVEHLEGENLGFGGFLVFSDDGLDVRESEDDETNAEERKGGRMRSAAEGRDRVELS